MNTNTVSKVVVMGFAVTFSANAISAPSTPTLNSPYNGQSGLSTSAVNFSWYPTGYNSTYRIVISQDAKFSGFVDNGGSSSCSSNCFTVTTTSTSYTKSMSCSGHTYYWKVRANDYTGASSWSPSRSFITAGSNDSCPASSIGSKVDAFVAKWNRNKTDFDGAYGAQCVDLMRRYAQEVLGYSDGGYGVLPSGDAYDIFVKTRSSKFTKIYNSPSAVPQKVDIVFWNKNSVNGYAGHVSIFISGDTSSFISFDQNWPRGGAPRKVTHNYTYGGGVVGWLRPKL